MLGTRQAVGPGLKLVEKLESVVECVLGSTQKVPKWVSMCRSLVYLGSMQTLIKDHHEGVAECPHVAHEGLV